MANGAAGWRAHAAARVHAEATLQTDSKRLPPMPRARTHMRVPPHARAAACVWHAKHVALLSASTAQRHTTETTCTGVDITCTWTCCGANAASSVRRVDLKAAAAAGASVTDSDEMSTTERLPARRRAGARRPTGAGLEAGGLLGARRWPPAAGRGNNAAGAQQKRAAPRSAAPRAPGGAGEARSGTGVHRCTRDQAGGAAPAEAWGTGPRRRAPSLGQGGAAAPNSVWAYTI